MKQIAAAMSAAADRFTSLLARYNITVIASVRFRLMFANKGYYNL